MKPPFHIALTSFVEQHAPDVHARLAPESAHQSVYGYALIAVSAAGSNIGTIRLLAHNAVIPAKAKHEFCHRTTLAMLCRNTYLLCVPIEGIERR
jgi:hypothetical protein